MATQYETAEEYDARCKKAKEEFQRAIKPKFAPSVEFAHFHGDRPEAEFIPWSKEVCDMLIDYIDWKEAQNGN